MQRYLNHPITLNRSVGLLDELPLWSAPFGLKLLDYIDYKPGLTALDIGFGTGFPLTELAMRLGKSSTVYGIDPWKEAVERVREKIEFYDIHTIRILEGYAESIPLDNHSVDLIVSNNGLNNVTDLSQVLSECSRIIKPGGQLVFTLNLDTTMIEFYTQLETVLLEMNLPDSIESMHRHISQKRPPLDHLLPMITRHDFIIKDMEHDQFNYRFADGSAMLNHYFIRLAFMDCWIGLIPQELVEPIFDRIESRLNQLSRIEGRITLSIPFILINAVQKPSSE